MFDKTIATFLVNFYIKKLFALVYKNSGQQFFLAFFIILFFSQTVTLRENIPKLDLVNLFKFDGY